MTQPKTETDSLPAALGGTPVRSAPMPARFAISDAEEAMIQEVIAHYREQRLDPGYQGVFEERYCDAFTEKMGGGHADAVATGTAAVFLALRTLDLPAGSEVIVSPITDPGCIGAIVMNGLVPRLADSAPGRYNMDAERFVERISDKTRAIMVVHSAGQATDIETIVAEAHARDIRVLEDCSQAHFATVDGTPVGNFGDIAAFSTMYRKAHMTGASGGIVFTRDADLFRLAVSHADRGKPRLDPGFEDRDPTNNLFPALNFHTDEISCGMGIASLGRIDASIRQRLAYVEGVAKGLAEASDICRPFPWSKSDSPFFYPVVVDADRISCSKIDFAEAVLAEGIGLSPDYRYVVARWPWARAYMSDDFDCPNAGAICDRSFNLYLNEHYGPDETSDTVAAIRKVESYFAK